MSNPCRDSQYLGDIQEAIRRIPDYTQALSFDAFMEHSMAQDAVLRNLQIIGEATNEEPDRRCHISLC